MEGEPEEIFVGFEAFSLENVSKVIRMNTQVSKQIILGLCYTDVAEKQSVCFTAETNHMFLF